MGGLKFEATVVGSCLVLSRTEGVIILLRSRKRLVGQLAPSLEVSWTLPIEQLGTLSFTCLRILTPKANLLQVMHQNNVAGHISVA